ncbi:major facilitator superfamily domain-containing protein 6-like isoform X2 [Limulus polyphemus]|uniref:Major facilitator superfamily domain-containing protein 6-like isoform X2 n=1 Tax=Limulus polyphemus TaxID=6850 RepID=A0ABM1SFA8_LIMPO|nr:major facilitator superfamily domain-containing protein 6-like isoform X2 [Limulus polyphemus]
MVEMKSLQEEEEQTPNQMELQTNMRNRQPVREEGNSQRQFSSKRDIIDNLCTNVNQDLLVSKTFYFFFFSAFGSLFPLLAVYFKQMGMSAIQSGLLIGLRPFIEFLSAPLWGGLADRFRKGKIMLLFSLFCWIVFTLALNFIYPPPSSCVIYNDTHHLLYAPRTHLEKRSVYKSEMIEISNLSDLAFNISEEEVWSVSNYDGEKPYKQQILWRNRRATYKEERHKPPPNVIVGLSPNDVQYTLNYNRKEHENYISPLNSSIVYRYEDVQEVFFLLLLLVILGEFFSAPAITLADTATLTYLEDNTDNYGKQRMFGSLGWGLAMFFVGVALDHSTSFVNHPCGPHYRERNYTICFATFSVLMGCAFIAATQFRFDYEAIEDTIPMKPVENEPERKGATMTIGTLVIEQDIRPEPSKEPEATEVLCVGLFGNVCRFLYISWLKNPWWVLPFEFIQGITHAAVWAACCSYITQATPSNLRASAQGVLQGLHHGLGRGCGAILGGLFVSYFGTQVTFRGYGFACLAVLIIFVVVNYYRKDKGFSNFQDEQEPDMVVEETSHLAPHGVPSNPMARSLSKQNITELDFIGQQKGGIGNGTGRYGTSSSGTYETGGFLGLPESGGGYYGGGGTTNYSDINMNNTAFNKPAFGRSALAAAFNPKGILAASLSPDSSFDYNYIKRDFQAYNEVLNRNEVGMTDKNDAVMGPVPRTSLYTPQPFNWDEQSYDW